MGKGKPEPIHIRPNKPAPGAAGEVPIRTKPRPKK